MSAYMDIIVKCTAAMAVQLIDEMRSFIDKKAVSNAWYYDMDPSEQAARAIADPYARFFYKDVTGEIVAVLALAYMPAGEGYNEGRLWVANVVPRIKDKLQPDEYNDIAKQFVDEILVPVLNKKWPNLKCEISQPNGDDTVETSSMTEDDDENVNEDHYADFKIGPSQSGKCIMYTCNPKELANLFGANLDAPQYLTPVFFKTAVLDKYRDEPSRYDVESGCLRCKRNGGALWCIPIDNHGKDCVSVFLGDLGHLPYTEQLHFASQNILKGEVSDTFFKSQIDAEFCDSTHPVEVFKRLYYQLRTVGWEALGWHLFLPLADGDRHYMSSLKLLTHDEQKEFDEQILALTKILIDSLNEKELHRFMPRECGDSGITLLENVFARQNICGGERHIKYLRNLQDLRSASVAHRKGKNYAKACKQVGLDIKPLSEVMESLFAGAVGLVRFLLQNVESFKKGTNHVLASTAQSSKRHRNAANTAKASHLN